MEELGQEDRKLVVLARAALARTGTDQGAALRDLDGRTYAGGAVRLASLQVSALAVCVSMAASSGSAGAEAAVVLGEPPSADDLAALGDFAGPGLTVWTGDVAGRVEGRLSS